MGHSGAEKMGILIIMEDLKEMYTKVYNAQVADAVALAGKLVPPRSTPGLPRLPNLQGSEGGLQLGVVVFNIKWKNWGEC